MLDSTYLRQYSEKNGGFIHESSKSARNNDIISELQQKDEDVRDQLSIDMDNMINSKNTKREQNPFMAHRVAKKQGKKTDNLKELQRISQEGSVEKVTQNSKLEKFIEKTIGLNEDNSSSNEDSYDSDSSSSSSSSDDEEGTSSVDEDEMQQMLVKSIEDYLNQQSKLEPDTKRKTKKRQKDKNKFDEHVVDLIEQFIDE